MTMPQTNPIAVISVDKRLFDTWLKRYVNEADRWKFTYVSRINDVRGRTFCQVVVLGDRPKSTEFRELVVFAESRIR